MKVLAVLLAAVFLQQTPDPNRIEDVRVTNNRRVPSETIKYNLQTKIGDRFNPAIIARDVKTLMALGHFDDVRVDEEEGKSGKVIIFWVKEKPTVRAVKYEGLKSLTNSEILEKLREKKATITQESL